ncbi:MAG: GTPase domain-containing protein [Candidatus Hodarchaeota archaeon]
MHISNKLGIILEEAKYNHFFGAVPIQKRYHGYVYPFETKDLDSQDERVKRHDYIVPCYFLVITSEKIRDNHLSELDALFAERIETLHSTRELTSNFLEGVLRDIESLAITDFIDLTNVNGTKGSEKRKRWAFFRRRKRNKKILILGDGAVGKTSLAEVLKRGTALEKIYKEERDIYGDSVEQTSDLYVRTEFFNSGSINLEHIEIDYLDAAGQLNPESGVHILKDFPDTTFHNVDIILFMFDLSESETFYALKDWIDIVNSFYSVKKRRPHFILVANKSDLESTVDREFITGLLSKEDFRKYFELSCLKGTNVNHFREWIRNFIVELG